MIEVALAGENEVLLAVPMQDIDPPGIKYRQFEDDDEQLALEDSLKASGQLVPAILKRRGERYEIVDGFRRYIGARHLHWPTLLARVFARDDLAMEAARFQTNFFRKDPNKVEVCNAFTDLMAKYNLDYREVAKLTRWSEQYVREIMKISDWPDNLREAVRTDAISFSAARELAKIDNKFELDRYLAAAIDSGCSPRLAVQWRAEYDAMKNYSAAVGDQQPTPYTSSEGYQAMTECFLCAQVSPFAQMQPVWIHRTCREQFEVVMRQQEAASSE